MKNTLLVFLIIFVALLTLSCTQEKISADSNANVIDIASTESSPLSLDEIINAFDKNIYHVQVYDDKMITQISTKLNLEGTISDIIHITNQSPDSKGASVEWAYVYKLSNLNDAIALEENRKSFVASDENGCCFRSEHIVVFGNSPIIKSIFEK